MSHHIYKTQAIILRGLPDGESNKYLSVFTRELGLVGATARSIRDSKSKLRYGLQDYSVSLVSLVRGKEVWRIINAVPFENIHTSLKRSPQSLAAAMRMLSLLRKLVTGEERHPELFDMTMKGLDFLCEKDLSREGLAAFQLVFALRVLSFLGYAVAEPELVDAAGGEGWSEEAMARFIPHIERARGAVRASLESTHLYFD